MFLLALLHAILFGLSFEPLNLWPLAFVSLVPLTWLALTAASTRLALAAVFATAVPMWLVINVWLVQVTVLGYPLMQVYLSFFPVLYTWLVRRLSRAGPTRRLPMFLVVPVVWTGVECLRGELLFDGYSWFLLGHPLIGWLPFVQSADLFGAYFISFLAALSSGAVVDLLRARVGQASQRTAVAAVAVVLLLDAGNLGYGVWRLRWQPTRPGPALLVIQTNLPQDNKIGWTEERQAIDVPAFIQQTRDAVAEQARPIDLIVWPETMLPGVGLEADTLDLLAGFGAEAESWYRWGLEVVRLQRQLGIPMLVGSPAWVDAKLVPEGEGYRLVPARQYNSAYLIAGDPPFARYDKYQLTPFGETMPYISAWPWLEEKMLALGAPGMSFALDRNPDVRLLPLPETGSAGGITLATPICFEDTVGRVCRRMVFDRGRKRADLMVNLSNDGWFGWSDAGRRQQNDIARFRCIENRVPLVRSVNTGLSVSVNSAGKVTGTVGPGRYGEARRPGVLYAKVLLDGRLPLYRLVGDGWAWACLAGSTVLAGLTFLGRTRFGRTFQRTAAS